MCNCTLLLTHGSTTLRHCPLPQENTFPYLYTLFRTQYVRRKSENPCFEISYSGGAIWRRREKFEYGCTTTNHRLYKASKTNLHGLIDYAHLSESMKLSTLVALRLLIKISYGPKLEIAYDVSMLCHIGLNVLPTNINITTKYSKTY